MFLRAIAECIARLSRRLGVCPSVRPSVTLVICIKTVQAKITKFSVLVAPRILVYRDKIFRLLVKEFSSKRGVKEKNTLKDVILPLLALLV